MTWGSAEYASAYFARDAELRSRWNRSLPPQDSFIDRWERARILGFGNEASIYASAFVFGEVAVGERTWIGPGVILDGSGGRLAIGAWCSVSAGVQIYTHDTVAWSLSGGTADRNVAPVTIGDRCHIGAASVIAAGSSIGAMCVVGAGSFVKGAVPDRTVVGGSPARVLGYVEGDGPTVRLRFERPARDDTAPPEALS